MQPKIKHNSLDQRFPNIVVIGRTGAGKSTLCNFLVNFGLEEIAKVSHGRHRGTGDLTAFTVHKNYLVEEEKPDGKRLFNVIDTPGLDDENELEECIHLIKLAKYFKVHPNVGGLVVCENFQERNSGSLQSCLAYFKKLFAEFFSTNKFAICLNKVNESVYRIEDKFDVLYQEAETEILKLLGKRCKEDSPGEFQPPDGVLCTYFDLGLPLGGGRVKKDSDLKPPKKAFISRYLAGKNNEDNISAKSLENRQLLIDFLLNCTLQPPVSMENAKFPLPPRIEVYRKYLLGQLRSFEFGSKAVSGMLATGISDKVTEMLGLLVAIGELEAKVTKRKDKIRDLSKEHISHITTRSGTSYLNLKSVLSLFGYGYFDIHFNGGIPKECLPVIKCLPWCVKATIEDNGGSIGKISFAPAVWTNSLAPNLEAIADREGVALSNHVRDQLHEELQKSFRSTITWCITGWISCPGVLFNAAKIKSLEKQVEELELDITKKRSKIQQLVLDIKNKAVVVDCFIKRSKIIDSLSGLLQQTSFDVDNLVTVFRVLLFKREAVSKVIALELKHETAPAILTRMFNEAFDIVIDTSCFTETPLADHYAPDADPFLALVLLDPQETFCGVLAETIDEKENKVKISETIKHP